MSNLQTPLSRRLPSDRCVPSWRWDYQSELNISNNFQADIVAQHQSRIQMRKVGDELANSAWLYCNQSDSIAYSLFVDVFYRPTCTFVNSFHLRAAHFRLDTIVQWRSGKLLLRDPGTAMASTPSETTQWPIQETHQSTESEMKKTDRDLCVCGNCSEMPTKEEQVCCGTFKGWKKRFKSGVIMTSFAISIAMNINS